MNRGCLHGIIKKRSDSLNLLFKEALVDYTNKLWKYEIITDTEHGNVLDPAKGGKEDRASSLCKALYNTVKVAEFPKQKIHMTHFLDTLEDLGGTETAEKIRKDLTDLGIHILPRYSVPVSDHKSFHSEPANPAVMGYNQGIGYEVPFVNESQIGRSSQSTMPVNCGLPTTPLNLVLPISQHPLKNNSAPNLLQHEILTGKTNAPQRQVHPSPQDSRAMQIPSESFQKFPIRESTDDSNGKAVEAFQGSGNQVIDVSVEEHRKVIRKISSISSLETDFVCNQYIYFRDKCQQYQEEVISILKTVAEQQKLDEEKQRAQYVQQFEAEKRQEMRDSKLKKQEKILREEEKRLKEQEQQQHRRQKEKEDALLEREKQLQVNQNQQQQESITLTKKKVALQDQERNQEQETKRLTKTEEALVERERILEERVKQQEKDTKVILAELKKRMDQMITIQQERDKRQEDRDKRLASQLKEKQLEGKTYIYSWLIHLSLLIVILGLLIYICFNVQ